MRFLWLDRRRAVIRVAAFVVATAMAGGCTMTAPQVAFAGVWMSHLPAGAAIQFDATQIGSTISGTVSSAGGLSTPSRLTGSVNERGVTLAFTYADVSVDPTARRQVSWTFHGIFTSATVVSGTIAASTGGATTMTITKTNGTLPL